MNSNRGYRFLNGKRLYKKLTVLRDESTIHDELFCTLEASKSSVIADLGVTDGVGHVIVFDNGLVDKFTPNSAKKTYTIQGKTETPDYVCFHTADLRQHPQALKTRDVVNRVNSA